jgi:D-glycero-alpha-D-manno-heptose 1-phosphate guanylyltransferase
MSDHKIFLMDTTNTNNTTTGWSSPLEKRTGISEVIILAGGLGTRLRPAVSDLPKCMAPVNNRPFISYVIEFLAQQGIQKFIFSLGYKSETITRYLNTHNHSFSFQYCIEEEPLGTGGAIKSACHKTTEENVLVTNGDTLFKINVPQLSDFHLTNQADCTLSLKPMEQFDRYGVVELDKNKSIVSFKEKQFYETGLINGGMYALNARTFLQEKLPERFSFEKKYLESLYSQRKMYGIVQDEYFIDIGIPEDYQRVQDEL